MRRTALVVIATLAGVGHVAAQDQPIQSPQDAACREEARANLFSTPNPQGLGLYQLGTQIYYACMSRSQAQAATQRSRRPRSR